MESEIVKRDSFIERLIEKTDSLEEIKKVGMVIIESGFCPEHFKSSKDAVGAIMCIEAGRKLGLTWMQSLSDIYPVKGRIGIMGTAAKAVIFASGVLESWHEFTEGEYPNPGYKHITISKRKDLPNEFRTEFSVFDASTAGLMGKDIYKRYGKRMIAWRDIGFHASDYYQDILKGMKTIEELNDFDVIPGVGDTTIEKEDGTKITVQGGSKQKSTKMTDRVVDKIPESKFAPIKDNISEAVVVNDDTMNVAEPPAVNANIQTTPQPTAETASFVPQKGSAETFNGKTVNRDEAPAEEGKYTLAGMEGMDTKKLLDIVNADMDMMEATEIIGGKNTNKKLREIIYAHQYNNLAVYMAPIMRAIKEREEAEANLAIGGTPPLVNTQTGEISVNKAFDSQSPEKQPQGKQEQIDAFLDDAPVKKVEPKVEAGNKYHIEIQAETPRDFSLVKVLFNKLMGVEPQITTPRYMTLTEKLGLFTKYPDKEMFLKNASVAEINQLLDSN